MTLAMAGVGGHRRTGGNHRAAAAHKPLPNQFRPPRKPPDCPRHTLSVTPPPPPSSLPPTISPGAPSSSPSRSPSSPSLACTCIVSVYVRLFGLRVLVWPWRTRRDRQRRDRQSHLCTNPCPCYLLNLVFASKSKGNIKGQYWRQNWGVVER